MTTQKSPRSSPVHIAKYHPPGKGARYLVLRQVDETRYTWFERQSDGSETETEVSAPNAEEALRLAAREWRNHSYRTVNCGFRYTLPERDEHGMNALFCQMAASQNTMNGVYFDEELGHNCYVQAASAEALKLLQEIK